MESKKAIEILVLIVLGVITALYLHTTFLMGPLRAEREKLNAQIRIAQARLDADGPEMRKLQDEEISEAQNLPKDDLWERLLATTPKSALVECPSLLSKWLAKHGIAGAKITLKAYLPFPALPGSTLQLWNIQGPVAPITLGTALAELENQNPMVQISEVTLEKNKTDGSLQSNLGIQFAIVK